MKSIQVRWYIKNGIKSHNININSNSVYLHTLSSALADILADARCSVEQEKEILTNSI